MKDTDICCCCCLPPNHLGYPNPPKAASIKQHAIEARIYAEDPSRNFAPSPGLLKVNRAGRQMCRQICWQIGRQAGLSHPSAPNRPLVLQLVAYMQALSLDVNPGSHTQYTPKITVHWKGTRCRVTVHQGIFHHPAPPFHPEPQYPFHLLALLSPSSSSSLPPSCLPSPPPPPCSSPPPPQVYREPEGPGIRVDSGVTEGSEISVYYDPMVAKLITTGPTRDSALNTMGQALDRWGAYRALWGGG